MHTLKPFLTSNGIFLVCCNMAFVAGGSEQISDTDPAAAGIVSYRGESAQAFILVRIWNDPCRNEDPRTHILLNSGRIAGARVGTLNGPASAFVRERDRGKIDGKEYRPKEVHPSIAFSHESSLSRQRPYGPG